MCMPSYDPAGDFERDAEREAAYAAFADAVCSPFPEPTQLPTPCAAEPLALPTIHAEAPF